MRHGFSYKSPDEITNISETLPLQCPDKYKLCKQIWAGYVAESDVAAIKYS